MTEAMTNDTANTTAIKSADAGGIMNSPDNLRDVAARVDQALEAEAGTFEQRAERLRNVLDGITGIELSTHERTRLMLQVAYSDCLYALNTEEGQDEFVRAVTERSISLVAEGENKFLPIVKAIWGRYVEKGSEEQNGTPKKVWEHNRSAEKYASVFRHLNDGKEPPETVAQYIENYMHKEHGKKINGIIAADRAKYGGRRKRSQKALSDSTKKLIATDGIKAFSRTTKPDFIVATDGPIVLVARVVKGRLELLGDIDVGTAVIDKGIADLAKRLEATAAVSDNDTEQRAQVLRVDFGDASNNMENAGSMVKDGVAAA